MEFAETTQLKPGTTLQNGKYKILQILGQGGFGITYLAEQPMLNRKVAIKEFFMKEYCDRDTTSRVTTLTKSSTELVARYRSKFIKEAQVAGSLDHPGIVRVYDIFPENDTQYFVMEYLEDRLKRRVKEGHFTHQDAIDCLKQLGEALDYIHSNNVLHLDVKPDNIMFRTSTDSKAVLIDYGISKRYDEAGGQTSTTPVGISKGYAPIEQYNQGLQNFSPATDVYSLGATLYFMFTGQTPPEASEVINEGLPTAPLTAAGINPATIECIKKSMAFRVKDRYASAHDFVDAVLQAENNTTTNNNNTTGATGIQGNDTEETNVIGVPEPKPTPKPTPTPTPKPTPKPAPTPPYVNTGLDGTTKAVIGITAVIAFIVIAIVSIFCIVKCNSNDYDYDNYDYDYDDYLYEDSCAVDSVATDYDYFYDNDVAAEAVAESSLSVSQAYHDLSWEEQTVTINVYSSSEWWISVDTESWIDLECVGTQIKMHVDSNPEEGTRDDYFIIKNDEGLTQRVDIHQE